MTTDRSPFALPLAAIALASVLAACSGPSPGENPLTRNLESAPTDVSRYCKLAARKCSQCHPIERVVRARVTSPRHWQRYVARMRMQPGAEISKPDGERILECLVYRSFGQQGLVELHRNQAADREERRP